MTTSLARQLALLRTPGSVKASLSTTSVYSGPFLFPEAETDHTSIASLKGCVADSISSLCQTDPLFSQFSILLELDEEEAEARSLVKDCLSFLCPHILNKNAQWLLQWLVTKHKVHINEPNWLVFTLLPYYSYKIYQSVLLAVDTTIRQDSLTVEWLTQFKKCCLPTSQPGLHRHVATSPAFFRFLCEAATDLVKLVVTHPAAKVSKQSNLLLSTLLGGLENIKTISEEQVTLLLQPVLAGLKSVNADLFSLATIILGYLLPRLHFKPKVVQKLCKSLGKVSLEKQGEHTLYVVLLIARTQKADMTKILELILKHRPSINDIVIRATNSSDLDNELLDTIDSLVYGLTLLISSLVPDKGDMKIGFHKSEQELLEMFLSLTVISRHVVEDTADFAIDSLLELIKQTEENEDNGKVLAKLDKTLEDLGSQWPEVYRKIFLKSRGSTGDIFFIPGVVRPSKQQLRVTKILKSNQLVETMSSNILVEIIPTKGNKKIIKKNLSDLLMILECTTNFLTTQIGREKFQTLLLNLLRIAESITGEESESREELQIKIIEHLCGTELMEILTKRTVVELMVLTSLITASPSVRTAIMESAFAKFSPLLSLFTSLSAKSDSFGEDLMEKLAVLVQPSHLETILANNCLLHNTSLMTVILKLIPKLVGKSSKTWSESATRILTYCLVKLNSSKHVKAENGRMADVVEETTKMNYLDWRLVIESVSSLVTVESRAENSEVIFSCLSGLLEKGLPEESREINEIIVLHLEEASLQFLLKMAQSEDYKVACFSLAMADLYCQDKPHSRNVFKNKKDPTILHMLSVLLSNHSKVQKAAFKLLDRFDFSSTGSLKPVLKFFIENKSEITNNVDNIKNILKKESVDHKATREILSKSMSYDSPEMFVRLCPLFRSLETKADAVTVFSFATKCLEEAGKSSVHCSVVVEVIASFVSLLERNLEEEIVWNFFVACLDSKVQTTVAGLRKSLPEFLLSSLAKSGTLGSNDGASDQLKAKLISALIHCSKSESSLESNNFVSFLNPSASLLTEQLQGIWGAEAFCGKRTSGRGKFSLLYGSSYSKPEDEERWLQTCWLLEVMDKILNSVFLETKSQDWLVLIRPLFVLLRKVSQMDEDTTFKMTLLLNILKLILTELPDSSLQNLDAGQVDPELLVHCIRSCPNPDTRQSALQVLARCVVFNPDFILQNSITIFTFMGSHLLKVDSLHSFHVACQALDVIVPAIKGACEKLGKAGKLQTASLGVLTTFVDACLDIPAHRLIEFLVRLITCLGDSEYLWISAILIVRKDKFNGERKVRELFGQFGALKGVEALVRILVNTRGDSNQLRKMFGVKTDRRDDQSALEKPDDWDLLRFRSLQIISSVLTSSSFQTSVGLMQREEEGEHLVNLLLEAAILSLDKFGSLEVIMPPQFRKNLVTNSEKVLEHSLALLPVSSFLGQVCSLLESETDSVRHRALEVVSVKLSPNSSTSLPQDQLQTLVSPLVKLSLTETQPHTQQLSLLAVRQLTKIMKDPSPMKEAAETFDSSFLASLANAKVLGAAVLTMADLLTSLGPLIVAKVPVMVTWICDQLEKQNLGQTEGWNEKEISVVSNSFLYCLQKLVESFVGFLSPSLPRLVSLSCRCPTESLVRARPLLTSLALHLPPHSVLAHAPKLLDSMATESEALPQLVNFVAENCRKLEKSQLSSVSKQFVQFYTAALNFRSRSDGGEIDVVNKVEETIITAFLSVALKLSLEDFQPVYNKLTNSLLLGDDGQLVTMFNFTNRVGAKLKSLFNFGLDSVIESATVVMKSARSAEVMKACLDSLRTVLTYNKLETVSSSQYEGLVSALLSPEILDHSSLPPCLAQLATATPEDTNWKYLHYQILLQLRDERPPVRMAVISVLTSFVTERMDTYLPVLPDAVPFLQEILEDDDTAVETVCRDFIKHMETTFGQNLESYFV